MKDILLLLFCVISLSLSAQTYTVGTQTITWNDPARSNRAVGLEFRYPGTNAAVANGQFPFVIFAHGFQMDQAPYYPYADSLAKRGYIVGLLLTEQTLSPSHANFAQDLIYAHDKLIAESNTNSASPFYQKVIPKGALGGHSMGGGSTVLSAQYGNPAACYFTFAAANTNPSSINAAPSMTKPYLAFGGSRDCVASPANHQIPMYNGSGSACKFFINITDGLHCQFGNGNFQCNFGEGLSFCASSPLSRSAQINKTLLFLYPFLDYYLKGDCDAWSLFEARYAANTGDAMLRSCTNVIPSAGSIVGNTSFCNGSTTTLNANPVGFQYAWNDNSTADSLVVSSVGTYSMVVGNGVCARPEVSVSVTENFAPAVPAAIFSADTVCSGIVNIPFSVDEVPGAASYNWILPTGWSIGTSNDSASILAASGNDGGSITVSAQNECGASATVVKDVVVVPSSLSTPAAIVGEDTLCVGSAASLLFSTTDVLNADSLLWSASNAWTIISGQGTNTVTVMPQTGSSVIRVSAVNACGASVPQELQVVVLDTPQVVISAQGSQLVSATTGVAYQWYLNGNLLAGEESPAITPTQSGDYALRVTDANGCEGMSQVVSFVVSGMEALAAGTIQIFPNPNAGGILYIQGDMDMSSARIILTDVSGKNVFDLGGANLRNYLALPELSKGIYILNIAAGNQTIRKKLVVQ